MEPSLRDGGITCAHEYVPGDVVPGYRMAPPLRDGRKRSNGKPESRRDDTSHSQGHRPWQARMEPSLRDDGITCAHEYVPGDVVPGYRMAPSLRDGRKRSNGKPESRRDATSRSQGRRPWPRERSNGKFESRRDATSHSQGRRPWPRERSNGNAKSRRDATSHNQGHRPWQARMGPSLRDGRVTRAHTFVPGDVVPGYRMAPSLRDGRKRSNGKSESRRDATSHNQGHRPWQARMGPSLRDGRVTRAHTFVPGDVVPGYRMAPSLRDGRKRSNGKFESRRDATSHSQGRRPWQARMGPSLRDGRVTRAHTFVPGDVVLGYRMAPSLRDGRKRTTGEFESRRDATSHNQGHRPWQARMEPSLRDGRVTRAHTFVPGDVVPGYRMAPSLRDGRKRSNGKPESRRDATSHSQGHRPWQARMEPSLRDGKMTRAHTFVLPCAHGSFTGPPAPSGLSTWCIFWFLFCFSTYPTTRGARL
jgi:hypothetical protein